MQKFSQKFLRKNTRTRGLLLLGNNLLVTILFFLIPCFFLKKQLINSTPTMKLWFVILGFIPTNLVVETAETKPHDSFAGPLDLEVESNWESRDVTGAGFHRRLQSTIRLRILEDGEGEKLRNSKCVFGVEENLDQGIYVDLDEIAEMTRFQRGNDNKNNIDDNGGGISSVYYQGGKIDVEKPAHVSDELKLLVYTTNVTFEQQVNDGAWEAILFLEIPFHLRYQRAQLENKFATVELSPPVSGFLACDQRDEGDKSDKGDRKKGQDFEKACVSRRLPEILDEYNVFQFDILTKAESSQKIELMVPVGRLEHRWFVSMTTAGMTLGGAVFLCYVALNFHTRNTYISI